MTLSLATIITAARAKSPAFDPSRVPDPVFASELTDYQNHLIRRAVRRDKTFLATSASITVNDTVFASGSVLPSNQGIIGGSFLSASDPNPDELTFTSFERRFDPPDFPAVYILNGTLYLCGVNADWTQVASLDVKYTPLGAAFAALSDLFILPDPCRSALVAYAAQQAAIRVAGLGEKIDVGVFAAQARDAEDQFLSSLRISKRARHSTMREGVY